MPSTDIKDYYRRAWGLENRPKFQLGSKWNVRSSITGRLLPEPIEEVKNYLISQGKNIEGITDEEI